jgi:hypothetical protein
VEEGLHEAAAAVVRVMYEEVVPDGTPALQLAKVCTRVGMRSSALLPTQVLVEAGAGIVLIMTGSVLDVIQWCSLCHLLCRCAR